MKTSCTLVLALAIVLSLGIAGCSSSPAPTNTTAPAISPPVSTPLPASTATGEISPLATPTQLPTALPSPTATTETSPLPAPQTGQETPDFDGGSAYNFVLEQCALGLRATGSKEGWATGDYLITQLESMGWQVVIHEFTYRDVKGRNIIGKLGSGPVAMLGAHYDTRPYADHNPEGQRDQGIIGANDGGSGVAVLLELARTLKVEKTGHEIWLVFFDAEDRGNLDDWPFSVGASELANGLSQSALQELAQIPEFLIVVDMVGDADQKLYYEGFSNPELNARIWTLAHSLGYESAFIPSVKYQLIDDHRPFINIGIPAIDIIDFDYPYWHTTADTADKVEPASLERVGRTLQVFLETGAGWQQ